MSWWWPRSVSRPTWRPGTVVTQISDPATCTNNDPAGQAVCWFSVSDMKYSARREGANTIYSKITVKIDEEGSDTDGGLIARSGLVWTAARNTWLQSSRCGGGGGRTPNISTECDDWRSLGYWSLTSGSRTQDQALNDPELDFYVN